MRQQESVLTGDDPTTNPLLHREWRRWLERYEWQWMLTLTFRDPPAPFRAQRLLFAAMNVLNRTIRGNHYLRRHSQVRWVACAENQSRGALHYHVLIGDEIPIRGLHISRMAAFWREKCGHLNRRRVIGHPRALVSYATKGVKRGGDVLLSPAGCWG